MKKFSKFFLIILAIFIVGGIFSKYFYAPAEEDQQKAEQTATDRVPGYKTMINISTVAKEQQLENAILDIEIAQVNEMDAPTVHIQSNEFMSEEVLLKDSYNMLTRLIQLDELASFTFIWYKPVNNKNEQFLSFTLDWQALNNLKNYTYNDIPSIASHYTK